MNTFNKGDLVEVTGTIKDRAGVFIDPSTVQFSFKDPNGAVTNYAYLTHPELVRDSQGKYHVNIDAAEAGTFYYRWKGSGAVGKCAIDGSFEVSTSQF